MDELRVLVVLEDALEDALEDVKTDLEQEETNIMVLEISPIMDNEYNI